MTNCKSHQTKTSPQRKLQQEKQKQKQQQQIDGNHKKATQTSVYLTVIFLFAFLLGVLIVLPDEF